MSEPTLRDLVFSALDNAIESGYGPELAECTPLEVAGDIMAYDDDVANNLNVFELGDACKFVEVHVKAWRQQNADAGALPQVTGKPRSPLDYTE